MTRLWFDRENHVYHAPAGRLPGATDVIKYQQLTADEYSYPEAQWRGKCVHRAVELLARKELDWSTVDEAIIGYVRSAESFLTTTKFEVVGCEEPCFDLAFACLPDLWGRLNGLPCIVELKTGVVPPWAAIQTALQKRALAVSRGFVAVRRFGLQLLPDGSLAKLRVFGDTGDERVAMSMVDAFHWKLRNGYIRDWK